ncbi:hypothetical protein EDD11_008795 [Mortierella claussenii]|nr:hypothetical protein EDD11_008795 [Mortierella claussenii]
MGEDNEIIVKPALPEELCFYEEAVLHPELQAWMPAYYGTLTLTREQPLQEQQEQAQGPIIKALNGYALTDLLSFDQHYGLASSEGQERIQQLHQEGQAEVVLKGENDSDCLCLENVSHGFTKACVLDLKLGTQLYDDNASEEKKLRLGKVAFETTSGKLGFRLTGFQVYDSEKGAFTKYSKHYGKGLKEETVLDGYRNYFAANLGPKRMRLVIERFVNDLTDILATLETQEVRMRSSSLLFMYEGDPEAFDRALMMEQEKIASVVAKAKAHLEKDGATLDALRERNEDQDEDEEDDEDTDDEDEDELTQKVTDLRLIDFAHSQWTPGQGPDEGVLLGIRSTLLFLEELLKADYAAEA